MTDLEPVRWLSELGMDDAGIAGGKGANLGELIRAGLPVPPGFVITAQAYLQTMEHAGLRDYLVRTTTAAPVDDPDALTALTTPLAKRIRDVEIRPSVAEPILAAYRRLAAPAVAVRSSATAEDTAGTSFAGMNETFTNVQDEVELLTCIQDCWASAYGARVIAYRASQHITEEPAIAVVVQTMVDSERSGAMFCADPGTGDRRHVVVEGAFGLGEVVVGGDVMPDTYILDRRGPRLLKVRIGYQDHKIIRGPEGHDMRVELSAQDATRRVLSDDEAVELARLALLAEAHFGAPQDIEWAIENGRVWLVQSRPITALRARSVRLADDAGGPVRGRFVAGLAAAPGIASGKVRILDSPEHADRFRDGEILVAPMTSPDWMPILRRAAALVTDGGGVTCHSAIVSRELGIPSVVGTRTATQVLHDGQRVTVDGRRGVVEEEIAATPAR